MVHVELNDELSLMEAGVDSLAAVDVRNRLAQNLNTPSPGILAFDHPTLAMISQHISARLTVQTLHLCTA